MNNAKSGDSPPATSGTVPQQHRGQSPSNIRADSRRFAGLDAETKAHDGEGTVATKNPGALGTGLSAGARTGAGADTCERIRAREAQRKREIEAAVEDALVAFCGTRRNPLFDHDGRKDKCDERMWANAAWHIGLKRFLDLTEQTKSQIRQKSFVESDRVKPSYFQENLTPFWKRGAK